MSIGPAQQVLALSELDLEVGDGDFVAVMRPSGSGKTTSLNCLSGSTTSPAVAFYRQALFDRKVLHEMSDLERTRQRAENVERPLLLAGINSAAARRRAVGTLERVGLEHRVGHRPMELSGGEQQRVTIARALAGSPRLVRADEPTRRRVTLLRRRDRSRRR